MDNVASSNRRRASLIPYILQRPQRQRFHKPAKKPAALSSDGLSHLNAALALLAALLTTLAALASAALLACLSVLVLLASALLTALLLLLAGLLPGLLLILLTGTLLALIAIFVCHDAFPLEMFSQRLNLWMRISFRPLKPSVRVCTKVEAEISFPSWKAGAGDQ